MFIFSGKSIFIMHIMHMNISLTMVLITLFRFLSLKQVKGDLYVDACPCLSGIDYCSNPGEFCTN